MPVLLAVTPRATRRALCMLAALLACVCMCTGCALPSLDNRTQSVALSRTQAENTQLGRAVAGQLAMHPGLSGIYPLQDPHAAFAARVFLARAAQRTLDVQYYIWRNDLTGTLLLEELHAAADRGVRVRLLLDDNGIPSSLDPVLAALQTHPNIEVRLFNPFVVRKPKSIGFLTDFSRANRRMHNKSFTADGTATIFGGRNIGDEYFGATDGVVFADLDVLAIGPAADDVAHDFDRYWASASSYPVDRIIAPATPDQLDDLKRKALIVERDPAAAEYVAALRDLPFVHRIAEGSLPFEWAKARMVSDDPAKGLNQAQSETLVLHQLHDILGDPVHELDLVSPYFVPTRAGTQYFTQLAARGVEVRVLTNSLEATDVAAVHSGYAKRRVELLKGGVELFELRRLPGTDPDKEGRGGRFGSSGSSLHAKTFAVDASRVFVGSFNFDPRSANLNTELGFIIDSPQLASQIEEAFIKLVPRVAYIVRLDQNGKVYWLEQDGDRQIRYDTEPNTSWYGRLGVWFMSILPIESHL
ncbi:phospholipase D family protein [Paraburkholderia sp.]|uniref:phospholipase D family protein n=1 Tax=Paraburkholderia sp. TaxID=1926495 RepID=UPI0039C961C1